MTGEDSPPGQKSPRVAGAGKPIDLPVKHRACMISPQFRRRLARTRYRVNQ